MPQQEFYEKKNSIFRRKGMRTEMRDENIETVREIGKDDVNEVNPMREKIAANVERIDMMTINDTGTANNKMNPMYRNFIIINHFFFRRDNERRYDDKKDYRDRREEHRNSRNSSDARASNSSSSSSSNSSSAIRRAEALNRQIERRASEKVQQLQKLGIEIPTLMQQQQQQLLLKAQNTQIKPLMSINTSVPANIQLNSNTTSTNDTTGEDDKNLTLNLSNFTSSVLTNARYTEQMQKKKLIWGAKKAAEPTTTNNKWEAAKFSQDNDGKVASKFLRLMGMKNVPATTSTPTEDAESGVQKREQMFSSMEQQYEGIFFIFRLFSAKFLIL